jgi:hypothetical protein
MMAAADANQRQYFRLNLVYPLCADFAITSIKGQRVSMGSTQVIVEDIGPGGIRFLSALKFPANDAVMYRMETTVLSEHLRLYGTVVRRGKRSDNIYEYGFKFNEIDQTHSYLVKLLNDLAISSKQRINLNKTRFFTGDKYEFLLSLNESSY